jgi:hypothetical protein
VSTAVYVEAGAKRVFACAVDWPGWARVAKDEESALAALADYVDRYRPVAEIAGVRFPASAGHLDVVERVKGGSTTDFGAPEAVVSGDAEPLTKARAERLAVLVEGAFAFFDQVRADAPAELRKGPRGGGRDRDKMAAHVLDAEAAYFRKSGLKVPPGPEGRAAFLEALRAARAPEPDIETKRWPWRYAARRVAWHALDHAWEMQDRAV